MKLKGKSALITGAGRGIGAAIALALAREGADIIINYNHSSSEAKETGDKIRNLGRRTSLIQADVTKSDQVQAMVSRAIKEMGKVDILVNNAGVISISLVEQMEEKDWDHTMNVNVKGVFLCCKAIIAHLKQRGGGKIINVASITGKTGYATLAHYCASKFAVVGFGNSLAKELAKDNITVNTICPGSVCRTYMWELLAQTWKKPEESIEGFSLHHWKEKVPQGRPQTPEDMAELAVFFATAENVTGQAWNVDGGMELH